MYPFLPCRFRCRPSNTIRRTHHSSIRLICYLIHKKIIIPRNLAQHTTKTAVLKESISLICQIAPYAHIRVTRICHTHILQANKQRIIANQTIKKCLLLKVCTIPQHHLCLLVSKPTHHLAYPTARMRSAVSIGKQQIVIISRFHTNSER